MRAEASIYLWYARGVRVLAIACLLAACGGSKSSEPARDKRDDPDRKPATSEEDENYKDTKLSKRQAKELILNVNAHIIVYKSSATFVEYRDVVKSCTDHPEVMAAAPFIFAEVTGTADKATAPMALKGIDPVARLQKLDRYMVSGSMQTLGTATDRPAIVLGYGLAKSLEVDTGDPVQVAYLPPQIVDWVDAGVPSTATFLVGGIFYTGFDKYDSQLAFVSLAAAQELVGRGDWVLGVEALVKDPLTSDKVAEALTKTLGGPPYEVQDWFELNKDFFETRD